MSAVQCSRLISVCSVACSPPKSLVSIRYCVFDPLFLFHPPVPPTFWSPPFYCRIYEFFVFSSFATLSWEFGNKQKTLPSQYHLRETKHPVRCCKMFPPSGPNLPLGINLRRTQCWARIHCRLWAKSAEVTVWKYKEIVSYSLASQPSHQAGCWSPRDNPGPASRTLG